MTPVVIRGKEIEQVESFKYLGAYLVILLKMKRTCWLFWTVPETDNKIHNMFLQCSLKKSSVWTLTAVQKK